MLFIVLPLLISDNTVAITIVGYSPQEVKWPKRFENGTINLPKPNTVEGCSYDPLPYCMVGDEIFPLKNWLMRPYPGRQLQEEDGTIYNYRHSRARRVIENAFGILVTRWRLFLITLVTNYLILQLMHLLKILKSM